MKRADRKFMEDGIRTLHTFNSTPELKGNTRYIFTDADMQARDYLKSLIKEAGLELYEDGIGNIFAVLRGEDSKLPPVWTGSHFDTVINGGMYDGVVGSLGAIEALRVIKDSGEKHLRDIVAVLFTSEESGRFGIGCLGSHFITGEEGFVSIEDTKRIKDDSGVTLYEAMTERGYGKDFEKIRKKKGDIFAFIELHIEQGPVLESMGIPIGIVTGITAPTYISVTIKGEQRHAGSTPMNARKDSMCAFAEIVLELESYAKSLGHPNFCATVGKVNVSPNASNVIAGEVRFTIDLRGIKSKPKDKMAEDIIRFFAYLKEKRGVKIEYHIDANDKPMFSNENLVELIEGVCEDKKLPYHKMNSGAYHDSLMMAKLCPMAMIFVPSKDGISHDPDEYTSMDEIMEGVDVLCESVLRIANRTEPLN